MDALVATPGRADVLVIDTFARPYYLASHAHVCVCGDQLVLLDVNADRYLALECSRAAALSSFVRSWPVPATESAVPDESLLDELLRRSLLTRDARAGRPATPAAIRKASADLPLSGKAPPMGTADVLAAVMATARAALLIRVTPLSRIVRRVTSRRRRSPQAGSSSDVPRLVDVFDRVRPFLFTAREACFLESLAVLEFLAAYDIYPTWIFGVRTKPFAAHCWLQHEDRLLTDSLERTSNFTPIMIV